MTFDDIATELGITRDKVLQLYRRALWKLRYQCKVHDINPADILGAPQSPLARAQDNAESDA